jgi:hypothetical protein
MQTWVSCTGRSISLSVHLLHPSPKSVLDLGLMIMRQFRNLLLNTRVLLSTVWDIKLLFHIVEIRLLQESDEDEEEEKQNSDSNVHRISCCIYMPAPEYIFKEHALLCRELIIIILCYVSVKFCVSRTCLRKWKILRRDREDVEGGRRQLFKKEHNNFSPSALYVLFRWSHQEVPDRHDM